MKHPHPGIISLFACASLGAALSTAQAATDYAVVPGSADNVIELAVDCPSDWRLNADLISLPAWVSRADITCTSGPPGASVHVSFDVASSPPGGAPAAIVLALQARDAQGRRVAGTLRRLILNPAATAPPVQQSFQIEECCIPTAGAGGGMDGLPARNILIGAVPNPWSDRTTIRFGLPRAASVSLRVRDLTGRLVYHMHTPDLDAGYHQILWEGRDLIGQPVAPGLYFYELSAGTWMATGKTLLLR